MKTAALWLAALFLCATPALAGQIRPVAVHPVLLVILTQPQALVLDECGAFWCVKWLEGDAPVCMMRLSFGLPDELATQALAEMREQCANPQIGGL